MPYKIGPSKIQLQGKLNQQSIKLKFTPCLSNANLKSSLNSSNKLGYPNFIGASTKTSDLIPKQTNSSVLFNCNQLEELEELGSDSELLQFNTKKTP